MLEMLRATGATGRDFRNSTNSGIFLQLKSSPRIFLIGSLDSVFVVPVVSVLVVVLLELVIGAVLVIVLISLGAVITSFQNEQLSPAELMEGTEMLARGEGKRERTKVPPTVLDPPPEPADWDGSVAIIGKMPPLGNAPSALTESGAETRGSITVRRDLAAENEYFRIYGRINHKLKATLREYRRMGMEYNNEVIYTGFKRVWTGQSEIQVAHLQRTLDGEFDVITVRDLTTGEIQYFKVH